LRDFRFEEEIQGGENAYSLFLVLIAFPQGWGDPGMGENRLGGQGKKGRKTAADGGKRGGLIYVLPEGNRPGARIPGLGAKFIKGGVAGMEGTTKRNHFADTSYGTAAVLRGQGLEKRKL